MQFPVPTPPLQSPDQNISLYSEGVKLHQIVKLYLTLFSGLGSCTECGSVMHVPLA
jgi:hypothetical protein